MKKLNDAEIKAVLDKDFQLFKLITARDVFLEFYNQRLLKRLMLRSQISLDIEKYMLDKFKKENGEEYIKKSETIIMNYTNSSEFCSEFHKETDNKFNSVIHFQPLVFGSNAWPFGRENELESFPEPFNSLVKAFEEHYLSKDEKAGHSLKWPIEGSFCELVGNFEKKYTIHVSLVQAIILTQVSAQENGSKLTYEQI
jgi:cobalamin biosynthesis Co2+ chelatase CbiK